MVASTVTLCVVALVLVLGLVSPGWFVRSVFNVQALQNGVTRTLAEAYQIDGVRGVSCPDGQVVEPGNRFHCAVRFADQEKDVTISVKNERGVYEVGRPK